MRGAAFDWRDRGWAAHVDARAARAAAVLVDKPGGAPQLKQSDGQGPDSSSHGRDADGSSSGGLGRRRSGGSAGSRGATPSGSRRRLPPGAGGWDAAEDDQPAAGDATPDTFPQLDGIRFTLRRGELLGICGEVRESESDESDLRRLLGHDQPWPGTYTFWPLHTRMQNISQLAVNGVSQSRALLVTRWVLESHPSWRRCWASCSLLAAAAWQPANQPAAQQAAPARPPHQSEQARWCRAAWRTAARSPGWSPAPCRWAGTLPVAALNTTALSHQLPRRYSPQTMRQTVSCTA